MVHRVTPSNASESKTAAAVTGSAATLAETFYSVADTGNQVLLFVGMRLSERPPDRTHPFEAISLSVALHCAPPAS